MTAHPNLCAYRFKAQPSPFFAAIGCGDPWGWGWSDGVGVAHLPVDRLVDFRRSRCFDWFLRGGVLIHTLELHPAQVIP